MRQAADGPAAVKRLTVRLAGLAVIVASLSAAAAVAAAPPEAKEAGRLVKVAISREQEALADILVGRNASAQLRYAINALTRAAALSEKAGLKTEIVSKIKRARTKDQQAQPTFANKRATKTQVATARKLVAQALALKRQAYKAILTVVNAPAARLELRSSAFDNNATIPTQFSCQGPSPPLQWTEPPAGTQSFALIVEDPDAPGGTFTHWITWGIPASARALGQGEGGPAVGRGDAGQRWFGPCPPPGAPHRYIFRLYALKVQLTLAAGATREQFLGAIQGQILAQAELTGLFGR